MYTDIAWLAIAAAGFIGCIATGIALNAKTGRPASVVWGKWQKHVWSMIFAAPLPFILGVGIPTGAAVIIAFLWLMLAPSFATKAYFGPKDAPWEFLMTLHFVFAGVALATYAAVRHFAG
ncbi:MAG: hypothetical protein MUC58_06795 [Rhizobiaceae bacterium]|jgi:hypothetical protein|nr:hypothetical protein [Rhizobiaceae bacterium]